MELEIFQIDAFTNEVFKGNPAAVVPMQEWLPDNILQAIAIENNQSETAYFIPRGENFELRWFTPVKEVDLCGHATLATAHTLFQHLNYTRDHIIFHTREAGDLTITRKDGWLTMDFPARPATLCPIPDGALEALGGSQPIFCGIARDFMFVYDDEETIRTMQPDFQKLKEIRQNGQQRWAIVTAPSKNNDRDFVSRFFCAGDGIDEDPVTGSAHCTLIPYWTERLGKMRLTAHQISARGGELRCELKGDRVFISGQAVTYSKGGTITVPANG